MRDGDREETYEPMSGTTAKKRYVHCILEVGSRYVRGGCGKVEWKKMRGVVCGGDDVDMGKSGGFFIDVIVCYDHIGCKVES